MKNFGFFALLACLFLLAGLALADDITVVREGNDVVVRQVTERYKDVPEGIPAENAIMLIRGEAKEFPVSSYGFLRFNWDLSGETYERTDRIYSYQDGSWQHVDKVSVVSGAKILSWLKALIWVIALALGFLLSMESRSKPLKLCWLDAANGVLASYLLLFFSTYNEGIGAILAFVPTMVLIAVDILTKKPWRLSFNPAYTMLVVLFVAPLATGLKHVTFDDKVNIAWQLALMTFCASAVAFVICALARKIMPKSFFRNQPSEKGVG